MNENYKYLNERSLALMNASNNILNEDVARYIIKIEWEILFEEGVDKLWDNYKNNYRYFDNGSGYFIENKNNFRKKLKILCSNCVIGILTPLQIYHI